MLLLSGAQGGDAPAALRRDGARRRRRARAASASTHRLRRGDARHRPQCATARWRRARTRAATSARRPSACAARCRATGRRRAPRRSGRGKCSKRAQCSPRSTTSCSRCAGSSGNTKDCPKCATAIEKNLGCNHMHCSSCNHDFCWVCLASWTGAHYSCTAGREASHSSIQRFSGVPLSFIGIRNWHVGRLDFARQFSAQARLRDGGPRPTTTPTRACCATRTSGRCWRARSPSIAPSWASASRRLRCRARSTSSCSRSTSPQSPRRCTTPCSRRRRSIRSRAATRTPPSADSWS
jgi:hypothetical protein